MCRPFVLLVRIFPLLFVHSCREGLISRSGIGAITKVNEAVQIEINVEDILKRAEGGEIERVIITAEVRGDFADGSANITTLGAQLRCRSDRSQCAEYDECESTDTERSTVVADQKITHSIVLVHFVTSPQVNFDFCPLGVFAQAIVTIRATISCPLPTSEPTPFSIVQQQQNPVNKKSTKSSSISSTRRFRSIVASIIIILCALMAIISAFFFLLFRSFLPCIYRGNDSRPASLINRPNRKAQPSSSDWRRTLSNAPAAKVSDIANSDTT
mmetsp:Transcript_9769/g.13567  ORF Transcript_9769/g.13567 Transcript_9769/m.13567 type:complete len:271 (-) Transcript_9769:32-844(-)